MQDLISKNPATGEELIRHSSFDVSLLPAIVERARVAQRKWAKLSFAARSQYLMRARNYMVEHIDEIALSISKNNGKPLVQALAEVMPMIETVNYAKKNAEKILKSKSVGLGLTFPTKKAFISYRPLGVVGIIAPWNYPLSTPMAEILFGLITGNAIIIKPSDVTGLVNNEIEKIISSMQLPPDIFTMIHGRGDVGAALVKSSLNRIIVTGSVNTGKKVMETASGTLTPVTLELGGKDCMIVLSDANIDAATSAAVIGGFYNTGQTCCSVERLIIEEKIANDFLKMFTFKLKKLRVSPDSMESDLGAVTFEGQKSIYLEQTKDFATSGEKPLFGELSYDGKSNFMPPLVVETQNENRMFWKDETFGPVVAVKTFKTIDEAIEINNRSAFGLTAIIWSASQNKAREEIAPRLNVGTVVINDAPFTNAVPSLPWGGVADSGFGWVHGELGIKEMCQAQVVTYDLLGQKKQLWWFPHTKSQYDFFKNYVILINGSGMTRRLRALWKLICALKTMGPRL